MSSPKKRSPKTEAALALLAEKKLDLFAKVVIATFVFVAAALELTLLSALNGKTPIPLLLEFNGVALSMFGGLWTALGVRMSPEEHNALRDLQKNNSVVLGEVIHSLRTASNFATSGAYCILSGGALLCAKVWFYHS